jgi:hypothetical protein
MQMMKVKWLIFALAAGVLTLMALPRDDAGPPSSRPLSDSDLATTAGLGPGFTSLATISCNEFNSGQGAVAAEDCDEPFASCTSCVNNGTGDVGSGTSTLDSGYVPGQQQTFCGGMGFEGFCDESGDCDPEGGRNIICGAITKYLKQDVLPPGSGD